MTSDGSAGERAGSELAVGQKCEMPECGGEVPRREHRAVRDPEGTLLEMCDDCLDDGWRAVVEVLD